jgi:hypothetical protein
MEEKYRNCIPLEFGKTLSLTVWNIGNDIKLSRGKAY